LKLTLIFVQLLIIFEEDFASEIDKLVGLCDGKSVSESIQNKTIPEIISTMID
jgi:hypothetical protein